jgi:hypothetical protein
MIDQLSPFHENKNEPIQRFQRLINNSLQYQPRKYSICCSQDTTDSPHISFKLTSKFFFFINVTLDAITHWRESFSFPEHVPVLLLIWVDTQFNSTHYPAPAIHGTYFSIVKTILFFMYGTPHGKSHRITHSRESFSVPEHVHLVLLISMNREFNCAHGPAPPSHRTYFSIVQKIIFFIHGTSHGKSHRMVHWRESFSVPEHVLLVILISVNREFNSAYGSAPPRHRTYFLIVKKSGSG